MAILYLSRVQQEVSSQIFQDDQLKSNINTYLKHLISQTEMVLELFNNVYTLQLLQGFFSLGISHSATGEALLNWLVEKEGLAEGQAVASLQEMLSKRLITSVNEEENFQPDSSLYR